MSIIELIKLDEKFWNNTVFAYIVFAQKIVLYLYLLRHCKQTTFLAILISLPKKLISNISKNIYLRYFGAFCM